MQDFLETGKSVDGTNTIRKIGAMALHHCQVSEDPYKVFVVKRIVVGKHDKNSVVPILNAKIIEKDKESIKTVLEGCLSFPDRGDKKVQRYMRIKVRYSYPAPSKEDGKLELVEEEKWMTGYLAQIFAHEIEHSNGKNIYT